LPANITPATPRKLSRNGSETEIGQITEKEAMSTQRFAVFLHHKINASCD